MYLVYVVCTILIKKMERKIDILAKKVDYITAIAIFFV